MVALLKGLLGPRSQYSKKLEGLLGFRPVNEFHYELAFRHSSMPETNKFRKAEGNRNNQRLEFLGDAILGSICSDVLFQYFPEKEEGFLSGMRSKIVNRQHLNTVAEQMGIPDLLAMERSGIRRPTSIYGDALEALIGAVYLDKGYKVCDVFVRKQILGKYVNLDALSHEVMSHKSLLHEWAQKNRKKIDFAVVEPAAGKRSKSYDVIVVIDNKQMARGSGTSKKKAEESAAEKVTKKLKLTVKNASKNTALGD